MRPGSTTNRFLILGAGGFIGTNLTRRLVAMGMEVTCYGHSPRFSDVFGNVRWIDGDLGDTENIKTALNDADCVVHLVSNSTPATSDLDPVADLEGNLLATVRLLEAMVETNTRRIIFLSSGGTIYGIPEVVPTPEAAQLEPSCSYGITKLAIEKYIRLFHRRHGLEYANLRVSNPFGPFQRVTRQQGVVASFISKAISGEAIEIWGDGSARRDFLYVDDLVEAICKVAFHPSPAHTLNIGSGHGHMISDVLTSIEKIHGRPLKTIFKPEFPVGIPASVLDISKAQDVLGWRPEVDWETGLERTYNWALQTIRPR